MRVNDQPIVAGGRGETPGLADMPRDDSRDAAKVAGLDGTHSDTLGIGFTRRGRLRAASPRRGRSRGKG